MKMKTNKSLLFVSLVALALATSSCITSKKVRYLRDMPPEGMPLNASLEATICPYDELNIFVSSNGTEEELLKPFNLFEGMSYLVDGNGDIQFPVLGNLHVEGLTRLQLQDTIGARLLKGGQLKDPLVMARFKNFKVFFLGVEGGKVLNIDNERCTFLEALAMTGGLDFYTRRDRIGVMREVNGRRVVHYLDPRSTSVFEDEFFLLQQNDIIFTEKTNYSIFKENFSNWTMILTSLTTLASLFIMYKTIEAYSR